MRPFTALPGKVLASLVAVLVLLGVAGALAPRWIVVLGIAFACVTAVGAALVAWEARLRRRGLVLKASSGAAVGAFASVAGLLVLLCAPDLTVKDAGEIGAAAVTLGVPHPTGFPLFCMLGKGWSLLPAGPVFFRVTLGSAIPMAVAAALAGAVAGSVQGIVRFFVAPFALLCAAGPWLHAGTTEVYALSVAGLAVTVLLAAQAVTRLDTRLLTLAAFSCGLGTGGHVTWPLYGAAFLVPCTVVMARRLGGRALLPLPLAFAMGVWVLAYLPVSAARDPVLNWGDPSTWETVVAHLTGERIRRSFEGEIGSVNPAVLAVRARLLGNILWESSGVLWPLALLGLGVMTRRAPVVSSGLMVIALCDAGFSIFVNPMGLHDLQTPVPLFWVLAVWCGAGAAWLYGRVKTMTHAAIGAGVLLVALVVQFSRSPADRDLRHVFVPRRAVSGLLHDAPPLSTVLTSSDDLSASLVAVQAVEAARPDLLVLIRPHLVDARQVTRRVQAVRATPADDEVRAFARSGTFPTDAREVEEALIPMLSRRGPLFVELGDGEADRALRLHLLPGFPVFRWMARPPHRTEVMKATDEALAQALSLGPSAERWGRSYLGAFVRLLGAHIAAHSGLEGEAIRVTMTALRLDSDDARTWHNLGVLLVSFGDRGRGIACLERAVRLDPGYVRGWRSLQRFALLAGRTDLALEAEVRARALTR